MIINWIKCADQMPDDNKDMIICNYGNGMVDKMRSDIFHAACKLSAKVNGRTDIRWTKYTKEKWEFLNGN